MPKISPIFLEKKHGFMDVENDLISGDILKTLQFVRGRKRTKKWQHKLKLLSHFYKKKDHAHVKVEHQNLWNNHLIFMITCYFSGWGKTKNQGKIL